MNCKDCDRELISDEEEKNGRCEECQEFLEDEQDETYEDWQGQKLEERKHPDDRG